MTWIFAILGFVGIGINCFAYVPQILHLIKEHCSAGISVKAWLLWLVASILIFLHAYSILDPVFITLQGANTVAITLIIVLSKRYQNMFCEIHRPAMQDRTSLTA